MADTEFAREQIRNYVRLLVGERNPFGAFAAHFGPGLIQHDPDIGDGDDGDEAFLEGRREENPDAVLPTDSYANVVHLLMADGDLVMMKSHVFISKSDKGRVFVDIWRLVNGKFGEHWSAIEPITETVNPLKIWCNVGGDYDAALAAGDTVANPVSGEPGDPAERAASLAVVRAFVAMVADPARIAEAVETCFADDFTEYSPRVDGQGKAALIASLQRSAARGDRFTEARCMADGQFVLVHGKAEGPESPLGFSQMHLFKVARGKIVAHWSVRQEIPSYSVAGRSMVDGPLEPGRIKGPPPAGLAHH